MTDEEMGRALIVETPEICEHCKHWETDFCSEPCNSCELYWSADGFTMLKNFAATTPCRECGDHGTVKHYWFFLMNPCVDYYCQPCADELRAIGAKL